MLPPSSVATTSRFPLELDRLPWLRRLAVDYVLDHSRVAAFFAGDPADPSAWREAIERRHRSGLTGVAIASIIAAQQQRREAPAAARAACDRLGQPQAVAVVTGQQAGLFGGPLFTLLKALTAIQLADQVTTQHGVPAVPVFWVEAEDHDWHEVKSCTVPDADLTPRGISVADLPGAQREPVSRLRLDGGIDDALTLLRTHLPQTEFTGSLLEQLHRAYRPGAGMATAFAQWLETLLGPLGLIVYDASDPAAKPLASRVFRTELSHPGRTSRLAVEAGSRLVAAGFAAQVTAGTDAVALFDMADGRRPMRWADGVFQADGARLTQDEAVRAAEQTPERFSPNVLLRPIVQDTLFPSICYVAGPNELAYLGQLKEIYAAFDVPMPLMRPRATATLLDSNAVRFLTRSGVDFAALRPQNDKALNELLAAQLPASVDAALAAATDAVAHHMTHVAAEIARVDPTLDATARSVLTRMQDDLKKLHGKVVQAAKRKDETIRRQFAHAQAQAFPGGEPQERAIGMVAFLNKYGPGLVDVLRAELPLDMDRHWLITV